MTPVKPIQSDHGRKWVWVFLAVLLALQLYFVRELIAVFFLFTLGFMVLAGVALAFFAVDRASQLTLAWAEPRTRSLSLFARRGLELFEEISKRPIRRPRSEPAQ